MHRLLSVCLAFALAACASTPKAQPYPAAQAVVETVAARHPNLVRLTLHATPAGASALTQVASTDPDRIGRPSDPEDRQALTSGELVQLDEPGAVDVTVPILLAGGKPNAIAGVTLKASATTNRDSLVTRASAIAQELEAEVRAAQKPLW
ncbi:MAG: hypothetical protein H6828_07705 [Planctomycetes bacterium]|nr:hypothetical protein [Planctomycetota bacterium]